MEATSRSSLAAPWCGPRSKLRRNWKNKACDRKRGGAASATSRPGRAACRRSCGYANSSRWRRRTGFCRKSTSPSSTAVFRSHPDSGGRFCALPEPRLGTDFLVAVRTQREPRHDGELSESALTDRASALASDLGGLPSSGAPTSGRNFDSLPTDRIAWVAMRAPAHGGGQSFWPPNSTPPKTARAQL